MGIFQDLLLPKLSLLSLSDIPRALAVVLVSAALYRLYVHPLAHVPGPWFAGISPLFLYLICYLGVEGRVLLHYHKRYSTPVLRIAPDAVSLSDGDALHATYVAGGGLPKDARYSNFRIEGHDTIFSSLDQEFRDRRAKAVLPLFAPARIQAAYERDGAGGLAPLVRKFIARLHEEKAKGPGARADILDLSSRLSIDILTGYLFHRVYGGLDEPPTAKTDPAAAKRLKYADKLSATPFVLAIVAFSRFSLLPNWLFTFIFSSLINRVLADDEVNASVRTVSHFLDGVVAADGSDSSSGSSSSNNNNKTASTAETDADTYQSRLLRAGVSRAETLVQCKGVVFAGADSTAVMLATIMFHLVQQDAVRRRLADEVAANPGADPQTLPYLRAVVREGLRVGMANPTRLTREVGAAGLAVSGFALPPGTKVGAAAYVFHHDDATYPEPFAFRPERWLAGEGRGAGVRDHFAYGLGGRACLGRNLANWQLYLVVREVVASGVLEGARTCKDKIEIVEWFNAEIEGHVLEVEW
ncbi:cytochrome P450 [Lasiosphaeria miniovina]|uniref:Cytochrome P450 n=1 Tax=Lasiosphaeria miniovina TaxID=1954250 RepID=A0AA40AX03_9PEZI|nr:cytochrome P450 [Lasiosphaeria miniovina]KAK0723564.1 cytochrome P450 [Lasiosphaeria miniovina]